MATCNKCNDTGVIETGNNDLPCDCPAGDTSIFNTTDGSMTGAQIKERDAITAFPTELKDRVESGTSFRWNGLFRYWVADSASRVAVVPPSLPGEPWIVSANGRHLNRLTGDDAEDRAFCVAATYARSS